MSEMQSRNQMIAGIDPGQTTGVVSVLFDGNDSKPTYYCYMQFAWGARFTLMPLIRDFFVTCDKENRDLYIVVEDFRLYESKAKDQIHNRFPSSQMIGQVELALWWIAQSYPGTVHKLVFQMANMIQRTQLPRDVPEDFPKSEHARDALKHIRFYSVTALKRMWL